MFLFSKLIAGALAVTFVGGLAIMAFMVYSAINPPASPPPQIEFSSVEVGDIVTVSVKARGDRVTRAELWAGDQMLAREINPNPTFSTPWAVAWQWQPPAAGV